MTIPQRIKPTYDVELDILTLIKYITYHAGHHDATENLVLEHCTLVAGSGSSEIPAEQDQSAIEIV